MPKRKLEKGTYYHVYNRGHNKQQIFFDTKDYALFYNNIPRYKEKFPNIQILAWCFLPNHFHFLLYESHNSNPGSKASEPAPEPGLELKASISNFMNRIQQSYAVSFNHKYGESVKQGKKGPVFEGRFKAKIVEDDDYFSQLKQYIEWNAVKHEIVENPEEWEYSSYSQNSNPGWDLEDEFNPYFE